METRSFPRSADTVIVGNGPSALILSYILHGNIPYYDSSKSHPDPILHRKLSASPCLLDVNVFDITAHFSASRISYSTQALPINVLLDTLIRPLADIDPEKHDSCVIWRKEEWNAIPHVVLGSSAQAGGQWADNPVSASWDIGALSYAEMLSLPAYTFEDHWRLTHQASLPDFHRPTRREVAEYFAAYPKYIGIADCIYNDTEAGDIRRSADGFYVGSHDLACKRLVLASGAFSRLIPPRPLLTPLKDLRPRNDAAPLLVVGSGFTAADVILSTPHGRKVLHIYKWDPEGRPSPLKSCHPRAYPEYARVYRQMKLAANNCPGSSGAVSPMRTRKTNPFFQDRQWDSAYEGLPNTYITHVNMRGAYAELTLRLSNGSITYRDISSMDYVIGRRGSLTYLNENIQQEIGNISNITAPSLDLISGQTLRSQAEKSLEIAPEIYVIGSLTGDSLIRFAYGGCVFAAREIIRANQSRPSSTESSPNDSSVCLSTAPSSPLASQNSPPNGSTLAGGHFDLHLHHRIKSLSVGDQHTSNNPKE